MTMSDEWQKDKDSRYLDILDNEPEYRKDVRLIVTVKNALILRKMEEMGIPNVNQLAKASGIGATDIGKLVNMKTIPRTGKHKENWKVLATKLANFLKCLPEDLFSPKQQYESLEKNTVSRDISMEEVSLMLSDRHQETPEEILMNEEKHKLVDELLLTIPPRTARIINLRFGLSGKPPQELEEVSQQLCVSKERIRQLEANGLRALRGRIRHRKKFKDLKV